MSAAAAEVRHDSARALVRDVRHLDARHGHEHFSGEVRRRTLARGGEVYFPLLGFRQSDDVLDVLRGERVRDRDRVRLGSRDRDCREIAQGIVRELRHEGRVDRMRRIDDGEGVSVGRCPGRQVDADGHARACSMVYHNLLVPGLRVFLAKHAHQLVGAAAGSRGDDDANGLSRKVRHRGVRRAVRQRRPPQARHRTLQESAPIECMVLHDFAFFR